MSRKDLTGEDTKARELQFVGGVEIAPLSAEVDYGIGANDAVPGLEHLTHEDVVIPRLRVVQKTSDDVDETNSGEEGKHPVGSLVLSGMGVRVWQPGDDPLKLVPIGYMKRRVEFDESRQRLFWSNDGRTHAANAPEPPDGTMLCADCSHSKFTTTEDGRTKGPRCFISHDYPAVIVDRPELGVVALSLSKTSTPAALGLNTMFAARRAPIYAWMIGVRTEPKKFAKGTAFVVKVGALGLLSPESSFFQRVKNLHELLVEKDVQIDDSGEAADSMAAETSDEELF